MNFIHQHAKYKHFNEVLGNYIQGCITPKGLLQRDKHKLDERTFDAGPKTNQFVGTQVMKLYPIQHSTKIRVLME